MQPTYISISTLFGAQTRHTVPLFQRPYVWTMEDQWEPLWEDISGLLHRLEMRQGEQQVASHFLGTIVLEQASNPTGSLPRREVIDGQQRLTTLQLLLKAAEHSLMKAEEAAASTESCHEEAVKAVQVARRQVAILTQNPAFSDEDEKYKVWPTNDDRDQFQAVMDSTTEQPPHGPSARMVEAYWYFRGVFDEYLRGGEVGSRAKSFSAALRDYLKLIVLDLDPSDEPQAIFETLNAHGTPLLPADLIKNWLLWEAARQKIDATALYEKTWRPFDKDYPYWRARIGTGHAARARVDTFLQNWLSMETGEAVSAKHLYDRFLRHVGKLAKASNEEKIDLAAFMASIRKFADLYERIDKPEGSGRFERFLERLQTLEIVVFHPLLLAIMDILEDDDNALAAVGEVLESFLIRRMVCNFQTRGYGSLAMRLLEQVRARHASEPIAAILKDELAKDETSAWPSDFEFRHHWRTRRFYGSLRRDRVLMILRALEEHYLRTSKLAEPVLAVDWSKLQIEHVMPQSWKEHWPLPDTISVEDRDARIHGIGNLTLVSGKLNPVMSNAPWISATNGISKRAALQEHSKLDLNKRLLDLGGDVWDEQSMTSRADQLFDIALKIWSA